MWIDPTSIGDDEYTSYMVRGGCMWEVKNTKEPTFSGPAVPHGHYEATETMSQEGNCLPDDRYANVGIYPSGLPWMEYAIQDWESGDIMVILKWDGTTYNGYDKWGQHIVGIIAEDGGSWDGIYGHVDRCIFSYWYSYTLDHPVLPNIKNVPQEDDWHFKDAYGIWNADVDSRFEQCADYDPDHIAKYRTLLCIWPNGPAVLNLIQCNDQRDDYQTILQQAWWRGGSQQWVGTDYGYNFVWGYKDDNDNGNYDDITFLVDATGNDGCSWRLTLWRGDDCETNGWKIGISILSVLTAVLLLAAIYLFTHGGSGGYSQYQ